MSPPGRRTDAAICVRDADALRAPMLLSERGPVALPKWGAKRGSRAAPSEREGLPQQPAERARDGSRVS